MEHGARLSTSRVMAIAFYIYVGAYCSQPLC